MADVKDILALAKPRITLLVALCSAGGFALASSGPIDWQRMAWMLVGVALASASTGCLNQVLEMELDGRMSRTLGRPLPMGRISPATAHAFGTLWGAAGLCVLALQGMGLACALTAFTLASYLLVYTPMKRYSPLSTWVGAIPGAMPPVIGWTAAGGALDERAAALFAIQFLWQLPHFLALAWLYRADYALGQFRVYPVLDPSGSSTVAQLVITAFLLLTATLSPYWLGMAGPLYLVGAGVCGGFFCWLCLRATKPLDDAGAKRVFLASLAYLPIILTLLIADKR